MGNGVGASEGGSVERSAISDCGVSVVFISGCILVLGLRN